MTEHKYKDMTWSLEDLSIDDLERMSNGGSIMNSDSCKELWQFYQQVNETIKKKRLLIKQSDKENFPLFRYYYVVTSRCCYIFRVDQVEELDNDRKGSHKYSGRISHICLVHGYKADSGKFEEFNNFNNFDWQLNDFSIFGYSEEYRWLRYIERENGYWNWEFHEISKEKYEELISIFDKFNMIKQKGINI